VEADNTQEMAELIENNEGIFPCIACSKDNMCGVETILDERLFANGATEIYSYGTLVMGRINSGEFFSPVDDTPITIRLQQDETVNQEASIEPTRRGVLHRGLSFVARLKK
jgi:hypothetical protein